MIDPINKVFVLKGYNDFSDEEMKNYIHIGLIYVAPLGSAIKVYALLQSGQSYIVNGVEMMGNGEVYPKGGSTLMTYAQIGDSITSTKDNQWETSWDDLNYEESNPGYINGKTGYKGNGYGQWLSKKLGIERSKHYAQGMNGRTTADYYDEWLTFAGKYGDFPSNVDFWTIFLGTNDWGTERHNLGTIADYINDTYHPTKARTSYGAMRKIIDRIRANSTGTKKAKIVLMTPLQRGAFAYGSPLGNFMKSAIIKTTNGYEYVANSKGFTLKDVVDMIKWIANYESFSLINLWDDSIVDKNYLNMAQTLGDVGPNLVSQDILYDNLHPTDKGHKLIGLRLIEYASKYFHDII
jgi:lysophospholipase L1-like esterase